MNRLTPTQIGELLLQASPSAAVYLVGAGGCGMSGLGHLLLDWGHAVWGSDSLESEEICQLRARGASIRAGHSASHFAAAKPVLAVYSSAIPPLNPELVEAKKENIPIVHRAALLSALLERHRGICVAGMHGKTTTSALVAFALEKLGCHPSYAIGAQVPQLTPHAKKGEAGGWFVVEADESDGSLRQFHPEHAILLNVDEEHLDHFESMEAICREFEDFSRQTTGLIVFCGDDTRLAAMFMGNPRTVSYGFDPKAEYRAVVLNLKSGLESGVTRFQIFKGGEPLGEFEIELIGEKNVSNAAAAIALLHRLGHSPAAIAAAIRFFKGAARRQHVLFHDSHYQLFDDYGHHPREILATLGAVKDLGCRRLLVAFQPHRFTRTMHLMKQFSTCFKLADKLWITDIYAASESPIPGVDGASLAAAVEAAGQAAAYVPEVAALRNAVQAEMKPGDAVLFIGAGDITRAAHALAGELNRSAAILAGGSGDKLAGLLSPEAVVRSNEPMSRRTTWRVGGNADFYVEPGSEKDLQKALSFCAENRLPVFILGRGSNLLVRDGGIRGAVICLAHPCFSRISVEGSHVRCGAGARLKSVVMEARRRGLGGFEFLEGIPGSVGGALRMNAGAMGSSLFTVIETVRYMDREGRVHERPASEIVTSYRQCPLLTENIALEAVLGGKPACVEEIDALLAAHNRKRWTSQPAAPSAGCVFKNPPGASAGKLIDEAGLKGTRVGGAVVSDVHANFIVNEGGASSEDVINLIQAVKDRVRRSSGVELETEVLIVGEPLDANGAGAPDRIVA
jgi:UDP-N-acetylmuramate--L-alanine ligase/UDP-N-acetylenolpyruvoylglucosamine reductase